MVFLLGANKQEGKTIAKGDLVVLASDLALHAVNAAQAAAYDAEAVSKLPAALRKASKVEMPKPQAQRRLPMAASRGRKL